MVDLVDARGRPIAQPKRPSHNPAPVVPRWGEWSSHSTRGLTPTRLAQYLQAGEEGDWAVTSELAEDIEEKDGHIQSQMLIRRQAVLGLELQVEAASDGAQDVKVADFVRKVLEQLDPMDAIGLDLMDAVLKGVALAWVGWRRDGAHVVPHELKWFHQKFLRRDPSGALMLATEAHPQGEPFEPWCWLIHAYRGRSGWPGRAGLVRTLAWTFLFKQFALKDWTVFAEVYGMPLRLGKYKPSASPEDKDSLRRAIQQLGSDAAGIISESTTIEFVESAKGTADVYERLASYCDRVASKVILGQTLATDTSGGTGTFAAANVHNSLREDLRDSDAKSLCKTLRDQLIRPLVGWNFGWEVPLPKLRLVAEEQEDRQALAELLERGVKLGMRIPRSFAHQKLGLPEADEGDDVLELPSPGSVPLSVALSRNGQDRLDGLVGRAHTASAEPARRAFAPLSQAASAVDPAAAQRALLEALRSGKDSDELAELMARTSFVARLEGEAGGADGE